MGDWRIAPEIAFCVVPVSQATVAEASRHRSAQEVVERRALGRIVDVCGLSKS